MEDLYYLVTPYSHPDPLVMEERFKLAAQATSFLMNQGRIVYSPIVHNHPIATMFGLPRGWDYWKKYDTVMLSKCRGIIILTIDGWRISVGLNAEKQIAEEQGLLIYYMSLIDGAYKFGEEYIQ